MDLYPQNMGTHLSIDEVTSLGELYTLSIIKAKGKNGSLVAIVAGTKTETLNTSVKLNLKKTSRYRNQPG
jgi:hypothetical protein